MSDVINRLNCLGYDKIQEHSILVFNLNCSQSKSVRIQIRTAQESLK